MQVDLITGSEIPLYTSDLAARMESQADLRILPSKSYGKEAWAQLYGMFDHAARVRRDLRFGAIVHIDSQRLAYIHAVPLPRPTVIVCHDVLALTDSFGDYSYETPNRAVRAVRRAFIRWGLGAAARIICPSEFTRTELLSLLPRLASRVSVVPWGVDVARFRPLDKRSCRGRLGLPHDRPLVLSVATESPRKNLELLVRAFARIQPRTNAILLKVGRAREPVRSSLRRLSARLGVEEALLFRDVVSAEELPCLYAAADVFVQPSLYEGFGIPPLEALASGTPVVASRIPSHVEVLADAARYCVPTDEVDLASVLLEILTEGAAAAELSARGPRWAMRYSWASCVAAYRRAYEAAAAAPVG